MEGIAELCPLSEQEIECKSQANAQLARLLREEEFKSYITKYYKGLFGTPEEGNLSLDEARTDDIAQVSDEENAFLIAPFTEEEVRRAIFQMEHNKAPGPDGFPAEF